ncbi:MAG: hypothetical protein IKO25_06815, partial [Clostridia bacterium]|nr:hypothetical protein [Clostridia bacterium]
FTEKILIWTGLFLWKGGLIVRNGVPDSLCGKVALNGGKTALRARNIQNDIFRKAANTQKE